MRNEASLRRLTEMGVDVYLPRAALRAGGAAAAIVAATDSTPATSITSTATARQNPPGATVALLTDAKSPVAKALLANVARALQFARIACAPVDLRDEAAVSAAAGLVMFGDAQARAVGALMPAQRQREIGWVVSTELALLAADARAKRALWSELKRMMRGLADARRQPLARAAAGIDHGVP
jgi:hypothetical protein